MSGPWKHPINRAVSPVPPDWSLSYVEAVVHYAQEVWVEIRGLSTTGQEPVCDPSVIKPGMQLEIQHLARILSEAYDNQCETLLVRNRLSSNKT